MFCAIFENPKKQQPCGLIVDTVRAPAMDPPLEQAVASTPNADLVLVPFHSSPASYTDACQGSVCSQIPASGCVPEESWPILHGQWPPVH